MKLKIAICVALAVLLQATLSALWQPLVYIDFPLIAVVYFALQRDATLAVITATLAGLSVDALNAASDGGALLGAGGFSKTLVAYLIAALSARVLLDNPLTRIPVLAGASAIDSVIYFGLHGLFTQPPAAPFVETLAFRLIATTVVGTLLFYLLDMFIGDRAQQRRQFAFRRRIARRGSLGRRKNY